MATRMADLGLSYVSLHEYSGTSSVTGHEANSCPQALFLVVLYLISCALQPLQRTAIVMHSNPLNLLFEILLC